MAVTAAPTRIPIPRKQRRRTALKVAAALCAASAFPLGTALYSGAVRGLNPFTAWACTSEEKGGLGNVSGWDLAIVHTSCDLVSRQEAISVYASPHGVPHRRWFPRRTLIFRYAPGAPDDLLPSFESTAPDRILISVPSISSVSIQRHALGSVTVNYHLGPIENPDPTGLGQAH